MYSVKQLKPGQTYRIITAADAQFEYVNKTRSYAVVDSDGNVVAVPSRLTGKATDEIFKLKSAATQEADFLNRMEAQGRINKINWFTIEII